MARGRNHETATDGTGGVGPDSGGAEVDDVSEILLASVSLLVRKMRQVHDASGLTLSERSALARLDRDGPTTSAGLARHEQISPQSMGATLRGLEERGLVDRRADPRDGRRVVLSVTPGGKRHLKDKRNAKSKRLAQILSSGFTSAEIEELKAASALIERVGQSL
jgi:DNA-binding MarR family transcriptional regulator